MEGNSTVGNTEKICPELFAMMRPGDMLRFETTLSTKCEWVAREWNENMKYLFRDRKVFSFEKHQK